ncbi:hypothetical protein T265_00709 [Opisthorchis viverrini]|uniref:Uncharacterized protein n=1 Tax=Opisthorchis viverrini TaxID=6198 RepID=A0A075A513_OPIVI|nr:hypothetical protein T265_00709 [Opisthorchis viverrini]KER33392.1 hypothetical protein T265_00709 [Opisthorchis viverrini]
MTSSRSAEDKITIATSKINKALGTYFEKTVNNTCSKIKQKDEEWFQQTVTELVQEFQQRCEEGLPSLLKKYSVNDKASQLEYANQNLRFSRSWCPSGDPEKDIRAHLYVVEKEHLDDLCKRTSDLQREIRPRLAELKREDYRLRDESTKLQVLLKQLCTTLATVQSAENHLCVHRPS